MSEEQLLDYLRTTSGFGSDLDGWILEHGRFFPHRKRPSWIEKMPDKECFSNAFDLALKDRNLEYCEGYATSLIPVMHAWCITEDGHVMDPTWAEINEDYWPPLYYGVVFDFDALCKQIVRQGHYGILPNLWMSKADPDSLVLTANRT